MFDHDTSLHTSASAKPHQKHKEYWSRIIIVSGDAERSMLCQGVKQSGAPRARYLQHLKIQASEVAFTDYSLPNQSAFTISSLWSRFGPSYLNRPGRKYRKQLVCGHSFNRETTSKPQPRKNLALFVKSINLLSIVWYGSIDILTRYTYIQMPESCIREKESCPLYPNVEAKRWFLQTCIK